MMELDELQSVRDRERQTDKLQQLRESFYTEAGTFIQQLRRERERAAERADDPFDAPEVNRLTDEIKTAEQTVEAIFEKRIGKIVKAASFAAADLPAQAEGMTAEEQDLFDQLVGDIKQTREEVLDVLAGEEQTGGEESTAGPADPAKEAAGAPTETATDPAAVSAADLMGADAEAADPEDSSDVFPETPDRTRTGEDDAETSESTEAEAVAGASDDDSSQGEGSANRDTETTEPPVRNDGGVAVDRETVRITDDVGSILCVDQREYDLAAEDVVELPAENAGPLIDQGAAERL